MQFYEVNSTKSILHPYMTSLRNQFYEVNSTNFFIQFCELFDSILRSHVFVSIQFYEVNSTNFSIQFCELFYSILRTCVCEKFNSTNFSVQFYERFPFNSTNFSRSILRRSTLRTFYIQFYELPYLILWTFWGRRLVVSGCRVAKIGSS